MIHREECSFTSEPIQRSNSNFCCKEFYVLSYVMGDKMILLILMALCGKVLFLIVSWCVMPG